jgi:hypothetical protein
MYSVFRFHGLVRRSGTGEETGAFWVEEEEGTDEILGQPGKRPPI